MKCRQVKAKISAYMDRELDPASLRHLESHLSRCDECREILSDFQKLDRMVHSLPEIELGPDFARQMVGKVSEARAGKTAAACKDEDKLPLFERLSRFIEDFVELVVSARCPSTRTLDEFSDFPPLSIGHAYFNVLDLPARG